MKSNIKLLLFVFLNTIPFMVGTVIERFRQDKNMAIKVSYNAINSNTYNDLSNIPIDHFASRKKPEDLSFSQCILSSPEVLTNETFANLTNIQYLDTLTINYCGLTKLEPGTFDTFTALAKLDLEYNFLASFEIYVKLAKSVFPWIKLSYNPLGLGHFPREAVRSLNATGKYAYLELSDTNIYTISEKELFEILNSKVSVFLTPVIICECFMIKIAEWNKKGKHVNFSSKCIFPHKSTSKSTESLTEKDFVHCNYTNNVNNVNLF